mmetsp:Transcript_7516/g.15580  ORF Transcript_7516/g.15580 Transcript_7516/m.15580 type:complete len:453 (-) Transcript_7516:257-1615(-)
MHSLSWHSAVVLVLHLRAATSFALRHGHTGPASTSVHRQRHSRRRGPLRSSPSSRDATPEEDSLFAAINAMRAGAIKAELTAAGIGTSDVFEKEELVLRLATFRKGRPAAPPVAPVFRPTAQAPASTSRVPMRFHSLTPDLSVRSKNSNVFLRPSPGKYPSININLPNQKRPLTLLVDTACSGIVLRPQIVQQYNLPTFNMGVTMQAAGGTTTGSSAAKLTSATLEDGTQLDEMMVAGQDIGALPGALDGIVGLSFFTQFASVAFDFESQELLLSKHAAKAASFKEMEVIAECALKLCRIGVWTVDVTLDGRGPVKMLLDTGAASTFINWKGVQDLNMNRDHPLISRNIDAIGAMGADNMALELSHRFVLKRRVNLTSDPSKISAFGPLGLDINEMGSLNIDIGNLPVLEMLKADNVGGILGTDVLMRCDVLEVCITQPSPKVRLLKRSTNI